MKFNVYSLALLVAVFATNSVFPMMTGMGRTYQEAWSKFPAAKRSMFNKESKEAGVPKQFYSKEKNEDTITIAEMVLDVKAGAHARKLSGAYKDQLGKYESLQKTDPEVYEEIENILNKAFDILSQ